MPRYEWPPTEGLVALCQKHGLKEAARRLGIPHTTLSSHLDRQGVSREDRQQEAQQLSADALKEIQELLR